MMPCAKAGRNELLTEVDNARDELKLRTVLTKVLQRMFFLEDRVADLSACKCQHPTSTKARKLTKKIVAKKKSPKRG